MPPRSHHSRRTAHKVRIIGGQWKRWQIPVADRPGLRPTPDRVRETLFNWVNDALAGARCLDLYAGTGALGLEALSRGAAAVHFVEQDRATSAELREQLVQLQCAHAQVDTADALRWLQQATPQVFDVVFMDPPYHSQCLNEACRLLAANGWLVPAAWVYLEFAADEPAPTLPAGWRVHRDTRAGQVCAWLCQAND